MDAALPALAAVASLLGSLVFLAGAVGLLRLPDFYTRIHAPTKAATLGLVLIAAGSMLVHIDTRREIWLEDLLMIFFVFLTIPVSSQVLIRGAAARGVGTTPRTGGLPPTAPIERLDDPAPANDEAE